MVTQKTTDSARVSAYEHLVTQVKNNTGVVYLNVLGKSILRTIENNICNFACQTTCLHTTTS